MCARMPKHPRPTSCATRVSATLNARCFPCNARGGVDLDALSALALDDYLYARVLVGREYGWPDVVPRLAA